MSSSTPLTTVSSTLEPNEQNTEFESIEFHSAYNNANTFTNEEEVEFQNAELGQEEAELVANLLESNPNLGLEDLEIEVRKRRDSKKAESEASKQSSEESKDRQTFAKSTAKSGNSQNFSSKFSRMSGNSFLVEYLNNAVKAMKELESATDLKGSCKEFVQKAIAAIQDVQRGLHQNLNVETLRKNFDEAWFQVSSLREEIEKQKITKDVLSKVSACQLYLQQFQGKLADKLNVESALTALKDFQYSAKSVLAETNNSIIDLGGRAVENVSQLRDSIKSNGVETLRTNFDAAYTSVTELRERLANEESIAASIKDNLSEKVNAAHSFLAGFKHRLSRISNLDVAVLALKDIAESVNTVRVEGKERFLVGLEFCRQKITGFQSSIQGSSNVAEYYETSLEALKNLEKTQAMLSMASEQREIIAKKIQLARASIEETVVLSKESISRHISLVNLNGALSAINKIRAAIPSVEFPHERLKQIRDLLEEMMGPALTREKLTEFYAKAFEIVNKLKEELANSAVARKERCLDQFNEAYSALTVAAVRERALSTAVDVGVNTALYAEKKFGVMDLWGSILKKMKDVDDSKLSGGVQNKILGPAQHKILVPALTKAQELDTKYLNGRATETVSKAVQDFQDGRKASGPCVLPPETQNGHSLCAQEIAPVDPGHLTTVAGS